MANIALIIAGGTGNRMGQDIPKQFLNVEDKPIIIYTLEAFENHPLIDHIAVVCIPGWENVLSAYARQFNITKLVSIVPGGKNGQSSIRNGVEALSEKYSLDDVILVHDAIRPMVSADIITDCIQTTFEKGNAITCIPSAEALLQTKDRQSSQKVIDRNTIFRTQTPQGFPLGVLSQMHQKALERGITNSVASCTLAIELGKQVYFSHGSEKNIKLTTVEDIDIFKALLEAKRSTWLKDKNANV